MTTRPFALLVLTSISLAACDSPTAPGMLPATVVTTFAALGSGTPPSTAASVAGDAVVVTGRISMGAPCYEFSATASPRRDSLVVTLRATRVGDICTANVVAVNYVITVGEVPTGTWQLHVVYDGSVSLAGTQTALDTPITVQ
jgi:hypothetical protein